MSDTPVLELTSEDLCLEMMCAVEEEELPPPAPTESSSAMQVTTVVPTEPSHLPETSASAQTPISPGFELVPGLRIWSGLVDGGRTAPDPIHFTPPEDPTDLPLFLPVRRGLCWRCGQEGHHRAICNRPPIRFCSRCGHRDRLSRHCPCRPWFPEEETTVLPPPRVTSTTRQFVSRGVQCRLDREGANRRGDRCSGTVTRRVHYR